MRILEKIIEDGLYLFIFLLPWQTRLILREGNLNGYWEYGTISIYATEILLWAIFAMAAVCWILKKLQITNYKSQINSKSQIPNTKHGFVFQFSGFSVPTFRRNSEGFFGIHSGLRSGSRLYVGIFSFLCIFVFWSFISIFWADSKSVAFQTWIRLAEGIGLFLVLRVARFDMIKLAWTLVASAVIQAGLGVWQFFSQSTFASKWLGMAFHDPIEPGTFVVETTLRRWLRAYGSLPHPNMLAGFLAVGMILSVWLYRKTDYGLKKLLLPICFLILTLGILATFSKSALVAMGVIVIFLWAATWISHRNRPISLPSMGGDKEEGGKMSSSSASPQSPMESEDSYGVLRASPINGEGVKITLLKFILFFLVITAIFSAVFWEPVSTRIYGQDRLEIKSTTERLSYFDQSWQLIKKHPFFGVGLGNYTLAIHNEINPNLQSWDYQPVHNIYLLVGAELGVIGFVFVFLFLCFFVFWFWKLFKKKDFSYLTLFSIVLFIVAVGFFDHYFWTLYFGIILLWLCLSFGFEKNDAKNYVH